MALVWWTVAVPALVKYPTDLDVRPRYEGVFTLFVDPETAAPLATPVEVPLEIERHIRAVGDESGASPVVVEETISQRAGDIVDATQTNVYVRTGEPCGTWRTTGPTRSPRQTSWTGQVPTA
jgi:hypothetical protein